MSDLRKEIEVAVNWWADQLSKRLVKKDNGDKSRNSDMAALMSMMIQAQAKPTTPEQIEKFKVELTSILIKESRRRLSLGVDYGPCGELHDAMNAAGIPWAENLPWKTWMNIDEGSVQVACGYGAPYVELIKTELGVST